MKQLILIIVSIGILSISISSFAIIEEPVLYPIDPVIVQTTLKPQTSLTNSDYVTFTYAYPGFTTINYSGQVTVSDGCGFVKSHNLSPIMYLLKPAPGSPQFNLNLVTGRSEGVCTMALVKLEFKGSLNVGMLGNAEINNFDKLFTLNWNGVGNKVDPIMKFDMDKLIWVNRNQLDYKGPKGYRYSIKYKTLPPGVSSEGCTAVRAGMAGLTCKYVVADPLNPMSAMPSIMITSQEMLRANLGEIDSIQEASFINNAISGPGFYQSVTKYMNKYYTRNMKECSSTMEYYELMTTATGYDKKLIRTKNTTGPVLCE
jgi:hypothetical protein